MASSKEIKTEIVKRIYDTQVPNYSDWTIGITSDPESRIKHHGNPMFFIMWKADSLEVAREVETYFLNEFPKDESKRMSGGTGGDIDNRKTIYVYIY